MPISDGDLPLDLTSQTTNSIPEPFSERSETIGSDNVDDYIPSSVESTAREQRSFTLSCHLCIVEFQLNIVFLTYLKSYF